MISVNATLVVQVIMFLVLVFILNRIMFRPILRTINERSQHINDMKRKIVNIEKETEDLVKKCTSMENDARKDASNENARFKMEALATAEKIFDDAKSEVAIIKDKVGKEIQEKIGTAQKSLQDEAMLLADVLIEKVIGRRIDN